MKTILAIVTKSPWPKGRIGRIERQDWYQTCVMASYMHRTILDSEVVVSSATRVDGADNEEEYYKKIMCSLNTPLVALGKGNETIVQLKLFKEMATTESAKLILLTTWSHYLRVLWLCWRQKVKAEIIAVKGIPRPTELITDIILTFVYPLVDICGLEKWFIRKVVNRRVKGKL